MCTTSLMTVRGTPYTWYLADRCGNSEASTIEAVIKSLAMANW